MTARSPPRADVDGTWSALPPTRCALSAATFPRSLNSRRGTRPWTYEPTPENRRRPARAAQQGRFKERRRQAPCRPPARSAWYGREVRGLPRARLHHFLSEVVDGRSGGSRQKIFRIDGALPGHRAVV